jgi:universal stress protein E
VHRISRVLAAVDFSKPARSAFEYALALSQHHGAELVVVQAVPPDQGFGWHARDRRALTAILRQKAEQSNVDFADRVQSGDPAEIILLHARSLRPDVIVLGTHLRRGIDRLRVGSVAERVVAKATAPVLLVPRGQQTSARTPFNHVAVAVDFGPGTGRAVEQALSLASDPADRITLLHVVPRSSSRVPRHLYGYGINESEDPVMRDALRRLELTVPEARHTQATVDARVLVGDTTTEISRAVNDVGADLLIVGVPKRSLLSRALFGTTAARLLKAIRVPLLALPGIGMADARRESPSRHVAA